MIKSHKVLTVLFASLSLLASLAVFTLSPPKAAAVTLTAGCWVSAPPPGGTTPAWLSRSCEELKKIYPSFSPESGVCYISWGTPFGPTPPVKAASCNGADDSYIPQPSAPPRYPFNNVPGATEAVNINPNEVNCFVADGEQGYRKVTCPASDKPPGCYVISSGVGPGAPSTVGQSIECNSIQNAVIEGQQNDSTTIEQPKAQADTCGSAEEGPVNLSIDIGCQGRYNPIVDMVFAFTRFLSIGAGIVCVASMIVGAIQFTASGGNPKATSDAIKRMASSAGALVFFLFIYAILNWIIPGGLL